MTENKIIDGKEISAQIREKVKEFGETLKKESGKNSRSCSGPCGRESSKQGVCKK